MKLPSEHIEDLDVKHHGIHLEGMRARSAERAAERALAHNPLLVVSAVAALVTMLFFLPLLRILIISTGIPWPAYSAFLR